MLHSKTSQQSLLYRLPACLYEGLQVSRAVGQSQENNFVAVLSFLARTKRELPHTPKQRFDHFRLPTADAVSIVLLPHHILVIL